MANLKLNYVTENALDEWFCDNVEITIYISQFWSHYDGKQTFIVSKYHTWIVKNITWTRLWKNNLEGVFNIIKRREVIGYFFKKGIFKNNLSKRKSYDSVIYRRNLKQKTYYAAGKRLNNHDLFDLFCQY